MKERSKKNVMRLGSAILAVTMGATLFPKTMNVNNVRADETEDTASDIVTKTKKNTMLGASQMNNPKKPAYPQIPWLGSFVYFGKYDGEPLEFRVLDVHSTKYTSEDYPTMLLDCEYVVYDDAFDADSKEWIGSDVESGLNDAKFLYKTNGFTDAEIVAIAKSTVNSVQLPSTVPSYQDIKNYVGLHEDKVFLLDYSDYMDLDYGYYSDDGITGGEHAVPNHQKNYLNDQPCEVMWTRSAWMNAAAASNYAVALKNGALDQYDVVSSIPHGISPALNIDLASILFATSITNSTNAEHNTYKLTLIDPFIMMSFGSERVLPLGGNQYFVPYEITGYSKDDADQVSILITDKEYYEDGASILYYDKANYSSFSTSGEFVFTIPEDVTGVWGKDYHVYFFAEDIHGKYETDYASRPVELNDPVQVFDVRQPMQVSSVQQVLLEFCCMVYGYMGYTQYSDYDYILIDVNMDNVNDLRLEFDGSSYVLSKTAECTLKGTYTIDFIEKNASITYISRLDFVFSGYDVTLAETIHGQAGLSTTDAIVGEKVTVTAVPDPGYEIDKITYQPKTGSPINITSTSWFSMVGTSVTVSVTFKPINYTVTVSTDGNGTAAASAATGIIGDTITLTATPNEGYQFKEWQVVSGGVTISNNSFVIGTENVEVKAIFEAISTPDPTTPAPEPTTPTPDPAKDPSFEDFVERLYTVALGRASEPEGKAFWVDQVVNKGATGADCARFFMLGAPEFLGRNLTDDEFVEVLYKTYFDRESEPDGKAYWLSRLASGTERAVLVEEFIESVEWCNVCATYGVKSGAQYHKATIPSKNAVKFATRLYTCCLGRDPEEDGLNYWSLALTNLDAKGYQAASLFFESPDFQGFNTSNEEYLRRLYTTFMG
ncbi:MAG: DUF4214 domain-containing protein, partial [Clostridiales bacterium]|nr:DUF4214 domain-containing protein [Clostridiales bacterium]